MSSSKISDEYGILGVSIREALHVIVGKAQNIRRARIMPRIVLHSEIEILDIARLAERDHLDNRGPETGWGEITPRKSARQPEPHCE